VNRGAVQRMQKEKKSKVHPVPLMQDLQLFHEYLPRNIHTTSFALQSTSSPRRLGIVGEVSVKQIDSDQQVADG